MKKILIILLFVILNICIYSNDITGIWDGILKTPYYEQRIVVYIYKDELNTLNAYFDSPYNSIFKIPIDKIKYKNNKIKALIKSNKSSLKGFYNKKKDELSVMWKPYKKEFPVIFKRIQEHDIDYFLPRIDNKGEQVLTYYYKPTVTIDDGWECSTLENVGMKLENINELILNILNKKHPNIHSILIVRDKKLVLEEYFYGFNKNIAHDLQSCTKAITSVFTGIAIDKGYIKDTGQKLYSFFPEYKFIKNWDDRKNDITIKHLLTMTSGFEKNNTGKEYWQTKDWLKGVLDLPLANDPGTKFYYDNISVMPLDGIIEKTTNMRIPDFVNKYLYDPLKIDAPYWIRSPNGRTATGHGHYMKPRDMAKIGYIMLYGGKWKSNKIISKEWIDESTKPYIDRSNYTGLKNGKYCYYWMRETRTINDEEVNIIFGMGGGEQYILIIPLYDIVMVMTAGNYWEHGDPNRPFEFIEKYISKSIK